MTQNARAALALALLAPVLLSADRSPVEAAPSPILDVLNQTIRWYRQQSALAALATDPSDVVFADAARRQSRQALQLGFQYARAAATLQAGAGGASGETASSVQQPSAIAGRAAEAAKAADEAQAKVTALERRAGAASARGAALAERELAEARSELALAQARRDTLRTFADFLAQQGGAGSETGLAGQIDELERSVPELSATPTGPAPTAPTAPEALRRAEPSGIVPLVGELLSVGRKERAVHEGAALTSALHGALDKPRAALVAQARATLQQGDALAGAPATTDAAALAERTKQIDGIVQRFKLVSAALVPLGKASVVVRAEEATLAEWRAAVDAQYAAVARGLALRIGLLALAIAGLLVASAFWRAATLRYVHDPRRRAQSLVARRVVVGAGLALVVVSSIVTEIGSLATFVGFITAGLAVALQNVILSVVAYFFLIGKYGVRVGDRVSISGVSGDVVDVGLVRLHLLEIGPDGLRTGRVVVFSNAVLFQPTANFFKQIPGSNFAWHQLSLTLSPDTDYRGAEARLVRAVNEVYQAYEPRIAQQHVRMSQDLSVQVELPRPHSQLHLTEAGLEMTIRFPVPLEHASEIDDRMTRALVEAISSEPHMKLAGSGTPTLQPVPAPAT